ncbi:DUF3152 domain-containing protein [Streptomyces sp. NPDC005202]|uniref:DUF3152 domain-containing protein n=1 Tax=Streptomyces sp. NPDC005202 TaxID=3157021 RepID=UPI0033A9A8CD
MGRHSRRGPAPKGDTADTTAAQDGRGGQPGPGAVPEGRQQPGAVPMGHRPGSGPVPGQQQPRGGSPAYGAPRPTDGTPAHGVPRFDRGTPAPGPQRFPDGTPARGVPYLPDGTPARGVPRLPDGTPAHGVPRFADGTPAHGTPRLPGGAPAPGGPQARGGHPEQREAGGGWGELGVPTGVGRLQGPGAAGPGLSIPGQRQAPPAGPRQAYLDAFDEDDDVFAPRSRGTAHSADPYASVTERDAETDTDDTAPPTGAPAQGKGGKGRTFTGIAAAAVTTVLAVVVAGQVADGHDGTGVQSQSAADQARDARDGAGADDQASPSTSPGVSTLSYKQKMSTKYPLSPTFKGSGKFDAVPGFAKAPGKGQKYTYRVDVEQGLGLDGELFAEAVQKTLNDDRSWAHNGARTFERIYSGKPDFVITLASPGTTAKWCAKSGLDTTEDNVSCDSAATERVMINAYRWAQGSKTYGDHIYAYRQMLINHEVGHRLGHGHVTCDKDGELAPVMQQQTKFLDHDGIHCLPNPWPYPGS